MVVSVWLTPMAKFMLIGCIIALAAIRDMEIHQMDVKTAFINGVFEKEIYMELLEILFVSNSQC
jgi:hypothetical protein